MGGGLATTALVAALRRAGDTRSITVLCAEPRPPYDRPPLSKEFFTAPAPEDLTTQFQVADAATWRLGEPALALHSDDDGAHTVVTASGGCTAPDVVVATGAAPVQLPWTRALGTWEQLEFLREALAPPASLGIIGGGWIGLEVAGQAAAHGVPVTVWDAHATPLEAAVPGVVGRRILTWLEGAGVTWRGGSAITDPGAVEADVVLAAVGARPATTWLPDELLDAHGNVWVDAAGRTSRPGLWATGDCAGTRHWNAALAAAERTAAALTGAPVPPPPVPHVFSTMFGHDLQLLGTSGPEVGFVELPGGAWAAEFRTGGRLTGALVVDAPRELRRYRTQLR